MALRLRDYVKQAQILHKREGDKFIDYVRQTAIEGGRDPDLPGSESNLNTQLTYF